MKKVFFFLFCISICVCIIFITDIYAKYLTAAQGSADIPIARWNIKVNDLTIKNNDNFSSTISPVFPGNEHIASNIIAPTAEGYFDLNFDFSGADVSFMYEISILPNANSSVSDLVVTGYSIDNNPITPFTGTSLSDVINYTDNVATRNIRIHIKWDDTSDSTLMDNQSDTQATFIGPALLDVNISFKQITQ